MTLSSAADTPVEERLRFGPLAGDGPQLDIAFDERVLRPRPWTAAQSEWAAELAGSAPEGPMLELCTGAGHIGLLAAALVRRRLVAVDLNPVACDFTRRNAAAAGIADLVEVREGRIDEVLAAGERFSVVIADPPWVRRTETNRFPEDPLLAIDGGDDGLDVAWACVAAASAHLLPGGSAVLQLGSLAQAERIGQGLAGLGSLTLGEIRRFERGVLARLDQP
ncbi:methyltransferase [Nocardioides ferulae]|uniref:methyltransferase n=1 Tax=Nocardioides ferulae TaxID=2340821 RepID=UPI000EAC87B0|nr:class I SAM-dependent methyltransferase [Nocardioides ferulae]